MICVLGDAHIDVVVRMSAPLAAETDTPASTWLGVGGQAANVAAWVAALGGRSRVIAARGSDPAAALVAAELARRGVELAGPVLPGRTGVVVSLSDSGRGRSMLTDRGVGPQLAPAGQEEAGQEEAGQEEAWLDGCTWLHLPGYSLVAEPIRAAALTVARAAARRQARLSIDLSSTAAITAAGPDRFRELVRGLRPDVVLGNRAEAELVGPVPGADLVVKLGADGVLVAGRHYPARPAVPVDATGAGDAFAAGYIVGGIELGLAAAARAVARMGAMP